jgi:hypothetical protein
MYQQPAIPTINSAADALGWPFRDPQWVTKILLMGLINIIPIVGQMALLGWVLNSVDNLRQGRQELAPAGFSGLGRGARLFVVILVDILALIVLYGILLIGGTSMTGSDNSGARVLGVILTLLGIIVYYGGLLAFSLLLPTIALTTDRGGIGAGLNAPAIIRRALSNPGTYLMAGLFSLIASIIAGFGVIACIVGVLFTTAWSYAVLAGLVYWLERNQGGSMAMQAAPPPPPPPPAYNPPPPPPP